MGRCGSEAAEQGIRDSWYNTYLTQSRLGLGTVAMRVSVPMEPVMPRTTDYVVFSINCPGVSIYAMRQWDGEVTKECIKTYSWVAGRIAM